MFYSTSNAIVASNASNYSIASDYNVARIYNYARSAINTCNASYCSTCGITCSASTASIIHYEVAITDTQE